jgi:LexA-binding, inner membrane-associated putative hydrolase
MFLWFVGTAIVAVWFVFRDPRFDYRLLVVGSVLPLLDALFGGARVMHTLAFSLAVLVAAMLLTVNRRRARRLWLGLAIGTLLHLIFDGAWTNTDVFWWPFGGWDFGDARLPEAQRGWWNVPLELIGLAILAWVWRTARLGDHARREAAWHTGRLFADVP